MFKKIQLAALAALALQSANAQTEKTEDFNIEKPAYTTQSNFSYLQIIDSRKDTASYGIVQRGVFNRNSVVKPKIPIAVQLENIFNSLKANDGTVPKDTLVLQLRDMKFAEVTEIGKETGYFYLRANAYLKRGNRYSEVYSTDIIETVEAMDVTDKNYKNASRIINDFMGKAMSSKAGPDRTFTAEQVAQIDNVEKLAIPLYTAEKLTNGIYTNYYGFKDQVPTYTDFKVERNKKGEIKNVKYLDYNGKYAAIASDKMYGFVDNGTAYIATEYGCYPLVKRQNDYFYTGKVKAAGNVALTVSLTVMYAMIGGVAISDNTHLYEIMIDHVSGTTILQTRVKG